MAYMRWCVTLFSRKRRYTCATSGAVRQTERCEETKRDEGWLTQAADIILTPARSPSSNKTRHEAGAAGFPVSILTAVNATAHCHASVFFTSCEPQNVCPSMCLSVCLCVCLSVCHSVCVSVCVYVSECYRVEHHLGIPRQVDLIRCNPIPCI